MGRRMHRWMAVWMMLIFLLPAASLGAGVPAAETRSPLDQKVIRILKGFKTVGASLTVAKDGKIIYDYQYGLSSRGQKTWVTENTYFRVASVTKMVSAIRIMQLVEQGKLDLDADLKEYFHVPFRNPNFPKTKITLRHLMTHTATIKADSFKRGIAAELGKMNHTYGDFYAREPGKYYRYSNLGAGLMGCLMEIATGKNVQENMEEGVFKPLGIDAGYHGRFLDRPEDMATTYNFSDDSLTAPRVYLDRPWDDQINPDRHFNLTFGSLWITSRDLCRIGMMLENGGELDGVRILSPQSVEQMMSSQVGRGGVQIDSPYGLCVNRMTNLVKGRLVYGHQGMFDSVVANLYFEPNSGLVFALAINGCNSGLQDRIQAVSRRLFSAVWDEYAGEK